MNSSIVVNSIKFLQGIAEKLQVGNVHKKAPVFKTQPSEECLLLRGKNFYPDIWKLKECICSSHYGGGIIDENNVFYESFTAFPWGSKYHPTSFLPYLGKIKYRLDTAIFLITPEAAANYYHWVVDLLPRLLIIKKFYPDILAGSKVILHKPLTKYQTESLKLVGINEDNILQIGSFELVYAKNIIITTYQNQGYKFPLWKKNLLQEMLYKNLPAQTERQKLKLYLLRGKQKKRNLIGEDHLIKLLLSKDFIITDPSKLNFKEQLKLLYDSQEVIALHGAALTNTIFCEEETLIIELRSTHNPPEFFSEIADSCNLKFKTVNCKPLKTKKRINKANKQNLLLTEQSLLEIREYIR